MNGLFQEFPPIGMPASMAPDMSVQYGPGQLNPSQEPYVAPMPSSNGPVNDPNNPIPTYTGHPIIDRYIHGFIGS